MAMVTLLWCTLRTFGLAASAAMLQIVCGFEALRSPVFVCDLAFVLFFCLFLSYMD